jgi:hypothetical protein
LKTTEQCLFRVRTPGPLFKISVPTWRNRQTRSPERLLLEVQVLPSAFDRSKYGPIGRRGSLKNCFLKVRILLPAFAQGLPGLSVSQVAGVAQPADARSLKGEAAKSFKFQTRLYSGQEMKDIMRRAGFEEVAVFGDLDGNEYGIDANRLIPIGRKSP